MKQIRYLKQDTIPVDNLDGNAIRTSDTLNNDEEDILIGVSSKLQITNMLKMIKITSQGSIR